MFYFFCLLRNHQFTNSLPLKIKELMDELYPNDLLDYTNGRVFISVTDIKSKIRPKNVLISDFSSREHCLDCVTASCLVPVWAGYRGNITRGIMKTLLLLNV